MFSVFKHLQWLSYKTPYKGKLKEVLIVGNYNLDKTVLVSLPKYLLLIDLTVLINTSVFNFASTCEEFEKKKCSIYQKIINEVIFLLTVIKTKHSLKLISQILSN